MRILGCNFTDVATTPEFPLGTVAMSNEDSKVYKYVQYLTAAGAVAAVVGNVAYYNDTTGYTNHQVTSDRSATDELGAGVLVSAPANQEYCWVQIRGPATLTPTIEGTPGDGDALTASGTITVDGALRTMNYSTVTAGHVCAFAVDASAKTIMCDFPF